jgi:hypothetical protein
MMLLSGFITGKHASVGVNSLFGGYKNAASPYSGIVLLPYASEADNGTGRVGLNNARNSSFYNVITGLSDARGFYILNRVLSTEVDVYKNKSEVVTQTMTSAALGTIKPLILASQIDDIIAHYAVYQASMFFMGAG